MDRTEYLKKVEKAAYVPKASKQITALLINPQLVQGTPY